MFKKIISILLVLLTMFLMIIPAYAKENDEKDPYKYVVGEYTIKYKDGESSSIKNCKIAAKEINGTVLKKGEEFSFNEIVGERTREKGYIDAPMISGGEYVNGLAGGICILSTCIFNAALESNFKITERNAHGLKVSYAQPGRDAMISWGYSDLKFKNNYNVPIKISIKIEDGEMTVQLLSKTKVDVPNAKVKTRFINGSYYTYRYIGWDINYITKSTYKN